MNPKRIMCFVFAVLMLVYVICCPLVCVLLCCTAVTIFHATVFLVTDLITCVVCVLIGILYVKPDPEKWDVPEGSPKPVLRKEAFIIRLWIFLTLCSFVALTIVGFGYHLNFIAFDSYESYRIIWASMLLNLFNMQNLFLAQGAFRLQFKRG